ncbi:MAG: hypothetical protein CM15mP74_05320 [Halieaceae bacterium]|nr:MAG: hypothetical protein CM15mP74_05320 [Halieaceae bacterium]
MPPARSGYLTRIPSEGYCLRCTLDGDGFVEGVANLSEWYFETFATDEASTEGLFEDYDHPIPASHT